MSSFESGLGWNYPPGTDLDHFEGDAVICSLCQCEYISDGDDDGTCEECGLP